MSVMRFDSFRDFDRLTQQLFGEAGRRSGTQSFPMDAYRRGDRFYVHVDLPGVDPDSIELTCERNVLTIRAERSFRGDHDDGHLAALRAVDRDRIGGPQPADRAVRDLDAAAVVGVDDQPLVVLV